MLTGFGAFGTEPDIMPSNGLLPVPSVGILEMHKIYGDRCATANNEQISQGYPERVCLHSGETRDREKYMNIGIGAAAGAVIAGVAVYALTR